MRQRINPDDLDNTALCLYPVSGTYGASARWAYYASLLSAILARRNEWLTTGIIAPAMPYSIWAVLHALVLVYDDSLFQPEIVVDNEILKLTTSIVATAYLGVATALVSKTFSSTGSAPILFLCKVWT